MPHCFAVLLRDDFVVMVTVEVVLHLPEHHGAVTIEQNSMLDMGFNSAS